MDSVYSWNEPPSVGLCPQPSPDSGRSHVFDSESVETWWGDTDAPEEVARGQ